jgi:outer membrane protein OmpA-like peptidoglycan-associated protein
MSRPLALTLALLCGLAAAPFEPARAQTSPSAAEIIERLKEQPAAAPRAGAPVGRTRGLSVGPGSVAAPPPGSGVAPAAAPGGSVSQPAVDSLFAAAPRGLSSGERAQVADLVKVRPTVDLVIYFDFNSAEIGPQAVPTLVELGKALTSEALANRRFLVGGHTDAKGAADYNLRLSERRAEAIRRYLVKNFHVDERRLMSVGFGEEQLRNAANPTAAENRRVQVVNLGG